jgi:predicted nucleotidyltransferase
LNTIIENNKELIDELCKKYKVKYLYAFGSVCTDRFNESSDIDLLIKLDIQDYVEYSDNYFLLAEEFENIFHRKVDLITDKSLSNPYFIESINNSKKIIYEN